MYPAARDVTVIDRTSPEHEPHWLIMFGKLTVACAQLWLAHDPSPGST